MNKEDILEILDNNKENMCNKYGSNYCKEIKEKVSIALDKYVYKFDFMEEKLKMYEELIKNSNFAPMIKNTNKVNKALGDKENE